jgi:hypothetical protein
MACSLGACTNKGSNHDKISMNDLSFDGEQFVVNTPAGGKHKLSYSFLDNSFETDSFAGQITVNFNSLIKESKANKYKLAYETILHDGIPVRVNIDNTLDTTLIVSMSVRQSLKTDSARIISGDCTRLLSCSQFVGDVSSNVVKWLYKNGKHIPDESIEKMYSLVKDLISDGDNSLYAERGKTIPVIKSFVGHSYRVQSSLKADYYYLFASSETSEIENFVAEVISQKFPRAQTSLDANFPCFRPSDKDGLLAIFLIGINKDWTKTCIPIGLVVIDNEAPFIKTYSSGLEIKMDEWRSKLEENTTEKILSFSKLGYKIVADKKNIPSHEGNVRIGTDSFRGDNAAFVVAWSGDVKYITIRRIAHEMWDSHSEIKKIDLTDKKSPYHFRYKLNLPLGENYIPIAAYDVLGNKSEAELLIRMVRNSNPQINIDNDIDIYN